MGRPPLYVGTAAGGRGGPLFAPVFSFSRTRPQSGAPGRADWPLGGAVGPGAAIAAAISGSQIRLSSGLSIDGGSALNGTIEGFNSASDCGLQGDVVRAGGAHHITGSSTSLRLFAEHVRVGTKAGP